MKSSEKSTADADTAKSEEHPQFSRTLSADDTDAAFRERLKNMGKCNYEFSFCYFIHQILLKKLMEVSCIYICIYIIK